MRDKTVKWLTAVFTALMRYPIIIVLETSLRCLFLLVLKSLENFTFRVWNNTLWSNTSRWFLVTDIKVDNVGNTTISFHNILLKSDTSKSAIYKIITVSRKFDFSSSSKILPANDAWSTAFKFVLRSYVTQFHSMNWFIIITRK